MAAPSSPSHQEDDDPNSIKNQVRDALRQHKIKLWCPPYYCAGVVVLEELEQLATSWKTNRVITKLNENGEEKNLSTSSIVQSLQEWQSHALMKLEAKKKKQESGQGSSLSPSSVVPAATTCISKCNLEIKILLSTGGGASSLAGQQPFVNPTLAVPSDIAESVEILDNSNNEKEGKTTTGGGGGPILLSLKGVSTHQTTEVQLLEFLQEFILRALSSSSSNENDDNTSNKRTTAINLRLVHRGKNISAISTTAATKGNNNNNNNNKEGTTLAQVLQSSLMGSSTSVPLLCLVSMVDVAEQQRANLQSRIHSIRKACCEQIRDTTKLEITDQHGHIVPMTKQERLGFVTALAFHRLGLVPTNTLQDSLVLLLEADSEWKNLTSTTSGLSWKDRVDNYGLLQLDIAWNYLQLGSLENLPDCLQRLGEAERVLMKQVHKNFVPLAIAQAEMGNSQQVPPLAAVFAKLFLLQGIAYLYDSSGEQQQKKGQERLDQAYVLLQCLRSMAPEESVQQLLEVMGTTTTTATTAFSTFTTTTTRFTASDAIAALRKSQGDLDAAVFLLSEQETKRRQHQQDREVQYRYGLCQNEKDPVNLTNLETLEPLLKGNATGATSGMLLDTANTDLAVGLLRLADNDMTRALEIYAEADYNPHKVYDSVDVLDDRLLAKGLLGRAALREKKKKRKLYANAAATATTTTSPPTVVEVDEMALVTLVSMGVDHSKATTALQKTGNDIEKAMVWLSTFGDGDSKEEEETTNIELSEEKKVEDKEDHEGRASAVASEEQQQRLLRMEREAQELLHRELGDILEERDLEKEYLGKTLDEEWKLVLKYRQAK